MLSVTTPEEASRSFATAHGFRHTHTTRISGVDPRTIEPPSAPPGVELRPLAELDPRKVYELDSEAMLDIPGEVAMDDVSFEQWLEDYWRHPDTDLDASVAAVIDGRPVAFSHLRIAPGGRAVTDMTGTLRDYRGRGLALLAKRATLVNAARAWSRARLHGERRDERADAQGQREARLPARRQHAQVVAALSARSGSAGSARARRARQARGDQGASVPAQYDFGMPSTCWPR